MAFAARGQIQAVDPTTVRLQGYATITGVEFEYLDLSDLSRPKMQTLVFDEGAFGDWLARNNGAPLPIYWSHNSHEFQIGETTRLGEDQQGLYFEGDPIATNQAIDALTTMAGRRRTGASLHLDFDDPRKDSGGVLHIEKVQWVAELGPCPVGANPAAYTIMTERASEASQPPEPAAAAVVTDAAMTATIYRAAARLSRRF